MKSWSANIQMKAYCPVILFIMLYKMVLTFESVDEILKCDHSNKSYWAVLSCSTVYYAVQGGSNFRVLKWNPEVWPFNWKLLSSTFQWCCKFYLKSVSTSICIYWQYDETVWKQQKWPLSDLLNREIPNMWGVADIANLFNIYLDQYCLHQYWLSQ